MVLYRRKGEPMKRQIAWLLIALLLLAALPIGTIADETVYSQGYLLYRIEDGGITICGYVGDDEEVVVIPNMLAGYPVSKIAAGTFMDCPQVKTIYLPDTIMEIEDGAIPTRISVVRDYNLERGDKELPIAPAPTGEIVPQENPALTVIDQTFLNPISSEEDIIIDDDLVTPEPTVLPTAEPTDQPADPASEPPQKTDPEQIADQPTAAPEQKTTAAPEEKTEGKGIGPGGIAAIVIGAVVALGVVAFLIIRKKKQA